MRLPRSHRLARSGGLAALLVLVAILAAGCTWYGMKPKVDKPNFDDLPEEKHKTLYPGMEIDATLDCIESECQTLYLLEIPKPGRIEISVTPKFSNDDIGLRAIFQDPMGRVLGQQIAHGTSPIHLRGPVKRGPYFVLIQGIGGNVDYTLAASLDEGAPAPGAEEPEAAQPSAADTAWMDPTPSEKRAAKSKGPGTDFAFDPEADFSRFKTYAFSDRPEQDMQASPGTAVGGAFLNASIQRAIRLEFLERGFTPVAEEEDADFVVSTQTGSRRKTWYTLSSNDYSAPYDQWFDFWTMRGATIRTHTLQRGTLVIDIIDVANGALVWHGWTTAPMVETTEIDPLVRAVVAQLLQSFPPESPTP